MFTTATQITSTSNGHDPRIQRLLADAGREVRELRLLARAGDLPERDARLLLDAAERRAARRRARLLTLGHAGAATTLELEAWHADPRDAETLAVRADLQECGLL